MSEQIEEGKVLQAWQHVTVREADAVERRAGRLARKLGCDRHLILDALTIELTGRFIGRERERRRQKNKILARHTKQ
jgi:hypothetical protein